MSKRKTAPSAAALNPECLEDHIRNVWVMTSLITRIGNNMRSSDLDDLERLLCLADAADEAAQKLRAAFQAGVR